MHQIPLDHVVLQLRSQISDRSVVDILRRVLDPPDLTHITHAFASLFQYGYISEASDEGEITDMLKAGYENAGEDMLARKLGEARVEAEALIAGIHGALAADGDLLSDSELADLQGEIESLQATINSHDPDRIRESTEQLGRASEVFAARRMDRSIQVALQGVALTDLEAEEDAP